MSSAVEHGTLPKSQYFESPSPYTHSHQDTST